MKGDLGNDKPLNLLACHTRSSRPGPEQGTEHWIPV